jgi:E3 ubiquitin-protein ligase BRE1
LFRKLEASRGETKPPIEDLENQLKELLANQKTYIAQIERLNAEKENISEQLDSATLRYMKAERKVDRARSVQVQRLEQQALAKATAQPAPATSENGTEGQSSADLEALQLRYNEATAAAAKVKEQLEAALAEIKGLQAETLSLRARKETMTEEEYSRTEAFKLFKNQNEDLIKRCNHLEATIKQLREESSKLEAERMAFRTQLESEAQTVTGELEDQIAMKEQDLTRIRSARDELLADVSVRKANQEQERAAAEHLRELLGAKDDRLAALELELSRLRPSEDATMLTPQSDLEALSLEELRDRYLKLERDHALIQQEVPHVEKAYKRAIALSQKKVMDFAGLEDKTQLLLLEKAKADQKYFAARKDMDIRTGEIRTLRHQNAKSSEIIASLKEVEAQNRTVMSNLEKQLTEMRQANITIMEDNKTLKASSTEANRRSEGSKTQITELVEIIKAKDAAYGTVREHHATQEVESEKLRVRLETLQKDRDMWKLKCQANSSEEEEALRVSGSPHKPPCLQQGGGLDLFHAANMCPEHGDLHNMQVGFQKHHPQDLRPPFLR